jgi:hypothetical protein
MVQGVVHEKFSFIEILQPAITYCKWAEYSKQIQYLEKEPETYFDAIKVAKLKNKFTLGVFYKAQRPVYHNELYGDHNPLKNRLSREIRLKKLRVILESK